MEVNFWTLKSYINTLKTSNLNPQKKGQLKKPKRKHQGYYGCYLSPLSGPNLATYLNLFDVCLFVARGPPGCQHQPPPPTQREASRDTPCADLRASPRRWHAQVLQKGCRQHTPTVSPWWRRKGGQIVWWKRAANFRLGFFGSWILLQRFEVASCMEYFVPTWMPYVYDTCGYSTYSIHGASGVAWWFEVDGCFQRRFRWFQVRG